MTSSLVGHGNPATTERHNLDEDKETHCHKYATELWQKNQQVIKNPENQFDYSGLQFCGAEMYIPVRFKPCPHCSGEITVTQLVCDHCDELLIDKDEVREQEINTRKILCMVRPGRRRKPSQGWVCRCTSSVRYYQMIHIRRYFCSICSNGLA